MVSEETIEAYKAMAKDSECPSMETQIRENLERTCDKFAGNEDKFERCLSYLKECAKEILEGKNGDVPDEVCYRICRDYFNDEIWKQEDAEKAERDAKTKAKKKAAEAKKKASEEKKAAAEARKAEIARKKAEALAKKKAEEEAKKAEPEKEKFPTCRVCGKEFINLYKDGMCADCYEKKTMQAEKSDTAHAAKIQPEPGQLDFFAAMGV